MFLRFHITVKKLSFERFAMFGIEERVKNHVIESERLALSAWIHWKGYKTDITMQKPIPYIFGGKDPNVICLSPGNRPTQIGNESLDQPASKIRV